MSARHVHVHLPARRRARDGRDGWVSHSRLGGGFALMEGTGVDAGVWALAREGRILFQSVKREDVLRRYTLSSDRARDALNHLGEREYQTYGAWRAAAKSAGATRFEGDKDIASAIGANGKHVGEWGGDKGSIYTKDAEPLIVVKAIIEGWNYGPAWMRSGLESEEYGPYPTKQDAARAAAGEMVKLARSVIGRRDARDGQGTGSAPTEAAARAELKRLEADPTVGRIVSSSVKKMPAGHWIYEYRSEPRDPRDPYAFERNRHKNFDHGGPFPTVRMATADAFKKAGAGRFKLRRGVAGGVYWDRARDADYEVIESVRWKNQKTGATASVYGAVPWTSEADKPNWKRETTGFTVRNNRMNTVGIGRQPWKTRAEAEEWVANAERAANARARAAGGGR